MKLQNLQGETAKVNENAYDTFLEPYIGCNVEIARKTRNYAWLVTDYGREKYGTVQVDISNLDFNT